MSEEHNIDKEIQHREEADDVVLEADEDNAEGGIQHTLKNFENVFKKAEADKQEYPHRLADNKS